MQDTSFIDILKIILDGGWVMVPLFLLGLLIFGLGIRLLLFLRSGNYRNVDYKTAEKWVENPETVEGQVGEMIRYSQEDVHSMDDIQSRFAEIRLTEVPRVLQRITVLNILVNAAPLLGLLGTVLGMLKTFQGISAGGSEKTTTLVAEGISEALITTQMGLFLAIPGYFLVYFVRSNCTKFEGFLVRLESITLQKYKLRFSNNGAS